MAYKNKSDQKRNARLWYKKHKAEHISRNKIRRNRLYQEIVVLKTKSCVDCGRLYPHVCMDFDHVRGKKKFVIARDYMNVSRAKLFAEIAKCDVICSNCHRIRTAQRKMPE